LAVLLFLVSKSDPVMASQGHTNLLSELRRRKEDEFVLRVMKMYFPGGADEQFRNTAESAVNEVISKNVNFLTNKRGLTVKTAEIGL